MITEKDVNRIFGITESFMLPERAMEILMNKEERERVFAEFLDIESNLSFDWFNTYFQEEHSSRKAMMQDFTPHCVCRLAAEIVKGRKVADICAGTGGLTIAQWVRNPGGQFLCEELSERAFPLLLFNLAIRNMDAYAVNMDVLENNVLRVFKITPGKRFGDIAEAEFPADFVPDSVIMNPPYSLKHTWDEKKWDPRFEGYGYPPKQFSDLAFVLSGFSMLKNDGWLAAILPHGVLFRGNREQKIRQKLVENGYIRDVIGLPENMFLNTGIPVFLLVLHKQKAGSAYFVDASKEFKKVGKINVLTDSAIEKIIDVLKSAKDIDRFSKLILTQEIAENDFDMGISRYVDASEPEPPIDILQVGREITENMVAMQLTSGEILNSLKELYTPNEDSELADFIKIWGSICIGDHREVGLYDIADVERAVNGKIYPAGTVYIQVSACRKAGREQFMETAEAGTLESKFAVILPKVPTAPGYLRVALENGAEEFMRKYVGSNINIQPDNFKFFRLGWHDKVEDQKRVADILGAMEDHIHATERCLESLSKTKNFFLDKVMSLIM